MTAASCDLARPGAPAAAAVPGRRLVSVVIPNRNGAAVLAECLRAAFASDHPRFEVVVVDDCSDDGSVEIIERFPCKLVRLREHGGVSKARNAGAAAASGELLVFIDSDCLLRPDSLSIADAAYGDRRDLVLGGTYTPRPYDRDFFSGFQSVFVHHFETKREAPDYVAAHAMVVDARLFAASGGFIEGSFIGVAASVEDVELSHRLRRRGVELRMEPRLLVQHVFRFSLRRSLANAVKKARYWTMYSMDRRDLLDDSGAASVELKASVALSFAQASLLVLAAAARTPWPLAAAAPLGALELWLSRRLVAAWREARGAGFAVLATTYYATLYAAAVALGGVLGSLQWLWSVRLLGRYRSCAPRFGTRGLSS